MGQFGDGSVFGYDPKVGGSLIFVGAAGSGKTVSLHTLVGGALARGVRVLICKRAVRTTEFQEFADFPGCEMANGHRAAAARLEEIAAMPPAERPLIVMDEFIEMTMGMEDSAGDQLGDLVDTLLGETDFVLSMQRLPTLARGQQWKSMGAVPLLFGRGPVSQSFVTLGAVDETYDEYCQGRLPVLGSERGKATARHADGSVQVVEVWGRYLPS